MPETRKGHFGTTVPKTAFNTKRWQLPPTCSAITPKSQISTHVTLWYAVLTYSPFWESAPNSNKMTFNTKRSKIPHVHITTTPMSQISIYFALRPAVFDLQGILGHVQWMNPKWTWTIKVKGTLYIQLLPTPSAKVHSVSLYGCFRVTGHFGTSALNGPKMTLKTKR